MARCWNGEISVMELGDSEGRSRVSNVECLGLGTHGCPEFVSVDDSFEPNSGNDIKMTCAIKLEE